jgi:hypothetical protein
VRDEDEDEKKNGEEVRTDGKKYAREWRVKMYASGAWMAAHRATIECDGPFLNCTIRGSLRSTHYF